MSIIKSVGNQSEQKSAATQHVAISGWTWIMLKELSVFYGVSPTEVIESLVLDAVLSKQGNSQVFCADE